MKSCVHGRRKMDCEPRNWWLEHQAKVAQMYKAPPGPGQDLCRFLKFPPEGQAETNWKTACWLEAVQPGALRE